MSKLNLSDSEIIEFKKDFDEILEYFKVIDSAQIDKNSDVKIISTNNDDFFLRDDEIIDTNLKENCIKQSKNKEDDYFKGPKTF